MSRARSAVCAFMSFVLVGVIAAPGAAVTPAPTNAAAAGDGAEYLASRQGADGSVPQGWRVDSVAEAVVALVAGGGHQAAVDKAVDFLAANARQGATSGPFTGRIVMGLVALGKNPRNFAGTDFVALLEGYYDPVSGGYGGDGVYADTLAMLGLIAAGRPLPDGAVTRLRLNQCDDGGWSHQIGCLGNPDSDTTSLAMSVLAAVSGTDDNDVLSARTWLRAAQSASGGWGLEAGNPDNANSTGLVVSAIIALGEDPEHAPWTDGDRDPLAVLRSLQLPSGGFRYRADVPSANDYATVQAVPALAAWGHPVRAPQAASPGDASTSSTTPASPRTTTTDAAASGTGSGERGDGQKATPETAAEVKGEVAVAPGVAAPGSSALLPWLVMPDASVRAAGSSAKPLSAPNLGGALSARAPGTSGEGTLPLAWVLVSSAALAASSLSCWRYRRLIGTV